MLEILNVSRTFEHTLALDGLSLNIRKGDFFSILGPSGCGKTTLLRILAGLDQPSSGTLRWNGHDITEQAIERRPFNMVFQRYALFPHLTVFQNVAFGPNVRGWDGAETHRAVLEALKLVHMDEFAQRSVTTLSGGQQQRVALARAIVNRPDVLLLDEPLSAIDQKLREQMRIDLLAIQRRLGITFILVTHDQEEALALSDQVAVMNKGHVEQLASPQEIYETPASTFVARFVGSVNALPVKVESTQGRHKLVRLQDGSLITARTSQAEIEMSGTKDGFIYLRPEHLSIQSSSQMADDQCQGRGTIREFLFKGPVTDMVVEINAWSSTPMVAQISSTTANKLQVGDEVTICWSHSAAWFLSESHHDI